jgi:hypothetical protein
MCVCVFLCVCVCVWKGYGLLNNSGSVDVGERKQGGEQQKFKHTMARKFFIDHLVVGVYFSFFWGLSALAAQFGL